MRKIPKGSNTSFQNVDKKLAGGLLAVALMGGATVNAHSSEILGGGNLTVSQQVNKNTTISGTVVDETGEPMIGVSVTEVGTKVGVATNIDGNFTLNVARGSEIRFSYIGYKSQSIKAEGQTGLTIKLAPDNNVLDDVVVVGYGTVKKRDLTGAISSVKADVITLTPSSNPMDALQGRVAGLDITQSSGRPGESLSIQLRGNRSITASGDPLFIIDGMPGNYATINPNDIESIEVLKDASSTAIYGSEGSNGVVIITTKKGKEGQLRINFDAYLGVNGWSTTPKMNSPEQFIATRELAHKNSGTITDDLVLQQYKEALANGQTIDWVDELLGTGLTQNYSLSLSGGTEKTQTYFSLNYSDNDGQYKNNNYKVYSSSLRMNTKLASWIEGGVHVQASYTDGNRTNSHLNDGLRAAPFGTLYKEDGSINPYPLAADGDLVNLLLDHDKNGYRNNNTNLRLYVQPYLRISPIKGLTLETRLSGNFDYYTKNQYVGYGSYEFYRNSAGADGTNDKDFPKNTNATKENSRTWGYTWENILTYNFSLADIHDFTITGVTSWNESRYDYTKAYATNIPSNTMNWTNLGAASDPKPQVGSDFWMKKRMGLVGRINYTLMGKYLFSASVRRDGDSRLSSDKHWATFPAISAGWRISDEAFMESTRTWLNNLKLRVGYGETGAAGIDPYVTWSIMQPGQINLGDKLTDISKFPENLANAALGWERSKSWNIGLDLGLLNNRIDLAAEYYITNTDDVIWKQSIPSVNGAYGAKNPFWIQRNIATTRNQGLELTLNTHNIETRDFTWSSTITFSTNKEKVTSLGAGAAEYIDYTTSDDKTYTLHVGDPIHSYRSYLFGGIWQTGEEADAAVFGRQPGDIRITIPGMRKVSDGVWEKDVELADGTIETRQYTAENTYSLDDNSDRVIIGHNTPDWSLGFQNTFTYKWFDLSVYMYWRYGQKFSYEAMGWYSDNGGAFPEHFNYWTPENPSNDFPALDSSRDWRKMPGNASRYWVDGSFFKIKNITLGYTLPKGACHKIGIDHLRLYGTITNPLVCARSKYLKGYDPEQNGNINFPLTRQLVFGLNVSF